jgi:hypothetical protein
VFVESTHAHNTIEIGGESYNRRTDAPYGSGLIWAGLTDDGLVVSLGEADHGEQGRHRRLLALNPGQWLLVIDRVEPPAGPVKGRKGLLGLFGGKGRDYRQWFHISPEFTVKPTGRAAFTAEEPTHETRLNVLSLAPGVSVSELAMGQTEPRLQGWASPKDGKMEPAPAIAMETSAEGPVIFATLLVLSVESLRAAGAELAADGDAMTFGWNADGGVHRVEIKGFLGGEPRVKLG